MRTQTTDINIHLRGVFLFIFPRTGGRVTKYTSKVGGTVANEYTYTYDKNGNITKITYADGKTITYTYDDLGQLLTEVNEVIGRSYEFAYDAAGNRTYTKEVNLSNNAVIQELDHTYQTNGAWGDALYTWRGEEWGYHTVDAIGNLTGIVTGPDLSFSWSGRQLTAVYGPMSAEYYTYNDQGQRITRTRDGVTTEYIYDGDRLLAEVNPLEAKIFLYDESNTPIGMRYRSHADTEYTTFWFEKNLQGDIVAVYSADGVKQLSYAYDAWGMPFYTTHISGTKAYENPFLYRGYYYEEDLTLYRTQTRLYDPYMGRFVSPDDFTYLGANGDMQGYNLYIYCSNNPVNYKQRPISSSGSIVASIVSTSISPGSATNANAKKQIEKTNMSSCSNALYLFGYELRISGGWSDTPDALLGRLLTIGFSSCVTCTKGRSGMLYAFAGSTSDIMNWLGKTYYAGVGLNLFNIAGAEVQLEAIGFGVQVSMGNLSLGANINVIGGTSITFGRNTNLGNGMTKTEAFTVDINTGFLVKILVWVYKAVASGDLSPVPGMLPI